MPAVSIILPTYNHEQYIAQSIQSVLDQEFTDFELIIIDDGSQDKTVKVAEQYSDSRIQIVKFAQNQGLSVALNTGIRHSSGQYIAVLHSDDLFLPCKLARQVHYLEEHPEIGAVFSHAEIIDEQGNEFTDKTHYYYQIFEQPNRTRQQWLNYFFYKGNCICHPSALIRKTCLEAAGFYDERLALLEDLDFWIKLCLISDIHVMQEKLVKYRVRDFELNASGQRPETHIRCSAELLQVLRQFSKIKDVQELLAIFPEAGKIVKNFSPVSIPFCIAKLALETSSPVYCCFALQVLYQLLEDAEKAGFIAAEFGFHYRDLIALAGQHDVFSLMRVQSLGEKVTLLEAELNASKAEMSTMLQSNSWKVTSPLRWVKNITNHCSAGR